MKKPYLAFFLSFILPGAGLWYLGKWKYGFINLAVVLAIGIIIVAILPDSVSHKYARLIGIACSGGSGGLALSFAQQMNLKKNEEQNKT